MDYYSVIKRNALESVLKRWMNIEPSIQSEVSKINKHQYSFLMLIYVIYGDNDPISKTAKETQM